MDRVGTRDAVISLYRRADGATVNALSVHRTEIPRELSARERAIIELLSDELNFLYMSGRLELAGTVLDRLPPRLRQIAELLMTDRSAKQIARELRLTVETTRYYIKQLYKRLEVGTRQEMMLKMLRGRE
jgi:DNA-binding CsgD family transcriptional regulator